jgi:serine/threonine protein kinase
MEGTLVDRYFGQQPEDLNTNPQPGIPRNFRPATDPLLGQQMGSYRLVSLLGSGGGAVIYLGEHRLVKDTYAAIKIPKEKFNHQEIQQFCKEASTLFRLVHPHIIRVLDFGVEGVTPYLVMDYAPNGTLRQRHAKGSRVALETIIPYVKQIASALQYAHDERIVHRDIKPENLLVGKQGQMLLADFGIAVVAHTSRSMSGEEVAGTVAYMAPEQCRGKAGPASDQYSLSIVVYEWLCGHPPFQGDDAFGVAVQQIQDPPPPLCDLVPSLPSTVEQVVHRALAKKPEDRFPKVQDFAEALEEASRSPLFASPSSSSQALVPVTSAPAPQKAPKRFPLWNNTSGLLLGTAMVATGATLIVLGGSKPLSPGSIMGSILTGLGFFALWLATRLT